MMQHKSNWIMPALALAGAVVIANTSARAQQAAARAAEQPTCEEHRFALTVGSRTTEASARSCLHSDGSLDVEQRTPGLPVQSFHMSPAAVACAGTGQSSCSGAPPQIDQAGCRSYSLPVTIGGGTQTGTRRACPQADGSWQVTQSVPGLPVQSYVVPANIVSSDTTPQPYPVQAYSAYPCYPYYPCYPSYPYAWGYDPWFFGPPFFFGSVALAFDNFHHAHRFDHFHDGNHAHFSHPMTSGSHFSGGGAHFNGGATHFSGGGMHFGGGHSGGGGHR